MNAHTPMMRSPALSFAATTLAFLALDALWLTTMSARLYRPEIGHLMTAQVDWVAALLFYVVYLGGLTGFAVAPARSVVQGALRGALFGLVAYATYDLTNRATLRGWPWRVTVLDLCWGAFASAAACAAGAAVARRR